MGVDQHLGVSQHVRVALKSWKTPFLFFEAFFIFCTLSSFFPFVTAKVVKMLKKAFLTSERHAKHLFAGQNTQHTYNIIYC